MRVIVADDSVITRVGITTLLTHAGCEVVDEVGDAAAALVAVRTHRPDVVVLDIRMPPTHTVEGLVAARTIRATHPDTAVLVLSQYLEPSYALHLLEGYPERVGYLLKDRVVNGPMLGDTLSRLTDGQCVIDPEIVSQLMRRRRSRDPLAALTERELAVLELLAEGHANGSIARLLRITHRTVETHATSVFTKLGLTEDPGRNRRVMAVLAFLDRAT
ncbi:MAG: response regulator transcription factor [Nocardioides sp.]